MNGRITLDRHDSSKVRFDVNEEVAFRGAQGFGHFWVDAQNHYPGRVSTAGLRFLRLEVNVLRSFHARSHLLEKALHSQQLLSQPVRQVAKLCH